MWQYDYSYLCHGNNYKYIDKYRDKRGNWQYVYPDDVPQKARTMTVRNDKPTNALNKGYSGQDYGKSGNTRFANVRDQITLDIKSRAAARENEKKAADKAYRKAAYNSAAEASKGADVGKYRSIDYKDPGNHPGSRNWQFYDMRTVNENTKHIDVNDYLDRMRDSKGYKSGSLPIKVAKDTYDYDKASKTSQMLKAATAKQKADKAKMNAEKSHLAENAQNAREAAIQKAANKTQWDNRAQEARSSADKRNAEIAKTANKQISENAAKAEEKNKKDYMKAIKKGDWTNARKAFNEGLNNSYWKDPSNTNYNYDYLNDINDRYAKEISEKKRAKLTAKAEKDLKSGKMKGEDAVYNLDREQAPGEHKLEQVYDFVKDAYNGKSKLSLSDYSNLSWQLGQTEASDKSGKDHPEMIKRRNELRRMLKAMWDNGQIG